MSGVAECGLQMGRGGWAQAWPGLPPVTMNPDRLPPPEPADGAHPFRLPLPAVAPPQVLDWDLHRRLLSPDSTGGRRENPPLPAEESSVMPAPPSRHTFTISHFIFLGRNLHAFKHVITLCPSHPLLSTSRVWEAGFRWRPCRLHKAMVVGGRAGRPRPRPLQPGWAGAAFGQPSLCGASPAGELAQHGVRDEGNGEPPPTGWVPEEGNDREASHTHREG